MTGLTHLSFHHPIIQSICCIPLCLLSSLRWPRSIWISSSLSTSTFEGPVCHGAFCSGKRGLSTASSEHNEPVARVPKTTASADLENHEYAGCIALTIPLPVEAADPTGCQENDTSLPSFEELLRDRQDTHEPQHTEKIETYMKRSMAIAASISSTMARHLTSRVDRKVLSALQRYPCQAQRWIPFARQFHC